MQWQLATDNIGFVGIVARFQLAHYMQYIRGLSLSLSLITNWLRWLASTIYYVKFFKVFDFFHFLSVDITASIRHAHRPRRTTQWVIHYTSVAAQYARSKSIKFIVWRYSIVELRALFVQKKYFAESTCVDFGRLNLMKAQRMRGNNCRCHFLFAKKIVARKKRKVYGTFRRNYVWVAFTNWTYNYQSISVESKSN